MLNIGLDYAFFNGRLNGSIEYYNKVTKDLIWNYPVTSFLYPFSTISANVGEITNRGIEISINAIPVQNKNFTWTTTLNLSHNKNKVNKLTNEKFSTLIRRSAKFVRNRNRHRNWRLSAKRYSTGKRA